ncbi:hypothetical protein Slin15195_G106180 [Septoria linicola]|uniref:Uncharacterized protein n=1 Tax=Septoria linicola TaxID=215465 RepID=A0A9Q9EP54_9PEZI|nr:hypothetical protein Slin15195_G106180 [Septoria linicola]
MLWPFKRRRRAKSHTNNDREQKPLAEKAQPSASAPQSRPVSVIDQPLIPQHTSQRATLQDPPAQRIPNLDEKAIEAQSSSAGQSRLGTANKENVPPPNYASREDITALPLQQQLERSPHLRPVDLEKPQIPYNFRPHSTSQTSVQRHDALAKLSKSNTLRSKRSTADYSTPTRRFSTKSKRDPVREEEIRSMTTPIPIPKRPGDGPLRRDSKKVRGINGDSHVSLPPEGSIHSSMSGVTEQRGWEVGSIAAVFSPRPAVRLSGLPQYVSSSLPPSSSGILYRIDSMGSPKEHVDNRKLDAKERRKRRTVGKDADELGASDLRAIMEREAKRKEKRQIERQERLERKLKSAGRERADSERKRRNSDERTRAEQTRARVEQELQSRGVLAPPSEVHPALRDNAVARPEVVGLGIGQSETPGEPPQTEQPHISDAAETSENPFTDAAETTAPVPSVQPLPLPQLRGAHHDGKETLLESPFEEPYVGTAQAVRLSMTNTPPLSPVYGNRAPSSVSQLAEIARLESASQPSVHDLAPPPRLPVERRNSDQVSEKRNASWAAFFRRGGTFRRSSQEPTSEGGSFSNTSRESTRNQPLPAHLVGTDFPRPPTVRSSSGTPVRTQSKFREDLPEIPISPPDSRTQSPDVTTAAPAVAAARRAARATPMDIPGKTRDAEGDVYMSGRSDTPLSAVSRGHVPMSASLASIDSEGSWLAGGASKRQSNQSALSRSFSKRNAEFTASYEELGTDKDAEYFSRNKVSRPGSRSNLIGASPDEESEEEAGIDTTSGEPPLTVHGSVRRKPTLVQRDPRLVSREGLVQEYAAQETAIEQVETPYEGTPEDENVSGLHTPDQSDDEFHDAETPEVKRAVELGRARSVDMKQHTARHSRQFSAGSARLLDMPPRRASGDMTRDPTPSPLPRPNPLSRSSTPN